MVMTTGERLRVEAAIEQVRRKYFPSPSAAEVLAWCRDPQPLTATAEAELSELVDRAFEELNELLSSGGSPCVPSSGVCSNP